VEHHRSQVIHANRRVVIIRIKAAILARKVAPEEDDLSELEWSDDDDMRQKRKEMEAALRRNEKKKNAKIKGLVAPGKDTHILQEKPRGWVKQKKRSTRT
jgi:hypothetical protein